MFGVLTIMGSTLVILKGAVPLVASFDACAPSRDRGKTEATAMQPLNFSQLRLLGMS